MSPAGKRPFFDIAVVGAGASGTLAAIHLLRGARSPFRLGLFERSGRLGEGAAYSTREAVHLLNVPAGKMSALPDLPEHFWLWAQRQTPQVERGDYLPRRRYALYLRQLLDETARRSAATLEGRTGEEVLDFQVGKRLELELSTGERVEAGALVLALGHEAPADLAVPSGDLYRSARYGKIPWGKGPLPVEPEEAVLLLGTGLTAVDAALSLQVRGHRGPIHALSRHGYLPQPHFPKGSQPSFDFAPPSAEISGRVLRFLQDLRGQMEAQGGEWRVAVDALRSHASELWQGLSPSERRRFLRHLRALWDVFRHRMAPEVAATITQLEKRGQLQIHAGHIQSFQPKKGGVEVRFRPRGAPSRVETLEVSYVLNCMGPPTRVSRSSSLLLHRLLERGWARPDPLDLGLEADSGGRVITAQGATWERLFVLGPLLRGMLWETTAVPEIAPQAQQLAQALLAGRVAQPEGSAGPPVPHR